jgi:hypothetical protein
LLLGCFASIRAHATAVPVDLFDAALKIMVCW